MPDQLPVPPQTPQPVELPGWNVPPTPTPMMPVSDVTSQIVTEQPTIPNNSGNTWFKFTIIFLLAFIGLGGAGGAFYMVRTTTDSLTKAAKTKEDTINEILNDADPAFNLVGKVEAGYEDPFSPSAEESNPFLETTNPFDEIGY